MKTSVTSFSNEKSKKEHILHLISFIYKVKANLWNYKNELILSLLYYVGAGTTKLTNVYSFIPGLNKHNNLVIFLETI